MGQKAPSAPLAHTGGPAGAAAAPRMAPLKTTYASASADSACTTGRKKLWTDAGWIVRRVTSCR